MKSVQVKGEVREIAGKSQLNTLRKSNKVPCVLYGGETPVHFSADKSAFKLLVYTPDAYLVDLEVNGESQQAVLQDIQYDPITDAIIHADFLKVTEDKAVIIEVPVKVKGSSPGVLAGGKLQLKERKLKVKAIPSKLPEDVTVDISTVKLGQSVKVSALATEDYEFVTSPNAVVVAVKLTRTARKADDEDVADEEEEGAETEEAVAEAAE